MMPLLVAPYRRRTTLSFLFLFCMLRMAVSCFHHHSCRSFVHKAIQRQASRAAASTLFLQKPATTGWINSDTLNLQQTTQRDRIKDDGATSGSALSSNYADNDTHVKYPKPSPVERLLIRDRIVYMKRDDCLHLPGSNISGNKARKFLSLNNLPADEFPDAIVSYGGPQSNAMVALAAIVSSKNAELTVGESNSNSNNGEQIDLQNGMVGDLFWELDVLDDEIQLRRKDEDDGGYTKLPSTNKSQASSSTTTPESTDVPKKRFIYYTKPIPRYLRKNPSGNLLRAVSLGCEIRTLPHDEYTRLFGGLNGGSSLAPADLDPPIAGKSLWVPQGGACSIAKPGSDVLATEIIDYWSVHGKGMPLAVCVPGGTCTTALLLKKSIDFILKQRQKKEEETMDIRVVVIPCVGDDEYAMRQMISLDKAVGGDGNKEALPWILRPREDVEYGSARQRSRGYFTFGQPSKALLATYDEMNSENVSLDLLYGAPAWSLLIQNWRSRESNCPIAGRQIMYIHTGGLEGVASQLTRYKHKNLLPDARSIQAS